MERLRVSHPSGAPDPEKLGYAIDYLQSSGAGGTWLSSPGYPAVLRDIPDPPAALFWLGDMTGFLERPAVAVIGSRRASPYGLGVARMLSRELAAEGVGVVSGLARGIDAEAHRGCLEAGGSTLAVLGSGIDIIYPREHVRLAAEIQARGCLVSEFPPGTEPDAWNFPRRNRLISGFSSAVVVVEAGDRSGTMITVDAALAQGRDVLAVPGEILRGGSRGTNRLLKEGAGVVTSASDVLDAIGLQRRSSSREAPAARLEGILKEIATSLCEGPVHLDELVRGLSRPAPELLARLLELEMAGVVEQLPGRMFRLKPGA